jgi:NACalpha-BTF3-like transcription factor
MNSSAQLSAAQHLASSGAGVSALAEKHAVEENEDEEGIPDLEAADEDEEPVDDAGLDAKEIELVMAQVSCSRARAVRALRQNGGDLINASTYQVQCFSCECFLMVIFSYERQRVKVLYRYVHYPTYDLPPPPTDFDVIVRPLPFALHNFDSLISGDAQLIPNFQTQFFCGDHH